MTRMTPSEAFVEALAANGVKHVFGIVGSAYMDALDLFEPAGIRFISVAHEQGAGHMADGYSRVLNRPGVCIAQNGPGITNFVTAIAAAYWAHSPVVMITPETGSGTIGLGGFQETEQLPIFSKITKYQAHVSRPDRIAELTNRAFHMAMLERGPTQVNIPRDFFYGEIDVAIPNPITISRGPGASGSLDEAARLLASAKFPVMVAGGGLIMSNGIDAARVLAEHLQCPVVTSYLHNDAFPKDHELMCGSLGYMGSKAAMRVIQKADVVLALGTRLGPFGTLPQYGIDYWPKDAKIIQVDADPRMRELRRLGLAQGAAHLSRYFLRAVSQHQHLIDACQCRLRDLPGRHRGHDQARYLLGQSKRGLIVGCREEVVRFIQNNPVWPCGPPPQLDQFRQQLADKDCAIGERKADEIDDRVLPRAVQELHARPCCRPRCDRRGGPPLREACHASDAACPYAHNPAAPPGAR